MSVRLFAACSLLLAPVLGACSPGGDVRGPGRDDDSAEGDSADVGPLTVRPQALVLEPGEQQALELPAGTALASSDPAVATVDASGVVTGVAYGEARVTATRGDEAVEVPVTVAEKELRGVWVTRWSYSSPEHIDAIMAESARAGMNAVFFQVRGRHDAFYDSELEPWAKELTGTLGRDPGWDPLAHAVDAAREHGLALHAYLNAYPFWSGSTPPASEGVPHPLTAHPDWLMRDDTGTPMALGGHYVWASPGHPEVRAHLVAVATDIASRYDVDGLHFDLVRYPGPQYSHDPASRAAWDGQGDYGDWQRRQIVETLSEVRQAVDVPLSAAVWGIYENRYGWSSVSQGNVDYYQDSWGFLSSGAIDANAPMIYWPVADTPGGHLDFATLAADHVDNASGRHVWAGINIAEPNPLTWEQTVQAIEAAREADAAGVILFEYLAMRDRGFTDRLASGPFSTPAVVPPMPWRE